LEGVLGRRKFRRYAGLEVVDDYAKQVRRISVYVPDPEGPPPLQSADPKDDYLIALAHAQSAVLVSGDKHLFDLSGGAPILSPADLLTATL
jgi:predicted nucleic acid-binding protein